VSDERTLEEQCYGVCWAAKERIEELEAGSAHRLSHLYAVNAELLEALKALTVAVTFADPPKEFNGALCHEARVPVGFVNAARAAIAKATEVKP